MPLRLRPLTRSLAHAFGGGLFTALVTVGPALAQAGANADTRLERVEITGSSIKRIAGETALPVQVLSRKDVERSGVSNVEQLLKTITATSTAGATSVANTGAGGGQGGGGSVALISLRGLGSARTLVLINGRRSAPISVSSAVDISTIPVAAIERVEVLKDGASAIYGSDAVAGVVNFILRKDFQGTEVSATLGTPTRAGGGQETRLSVFSGFGNFDSQGASATVSASHQHVKSILGASRPFASFLNLEHYLDRTNPVAFPANVQLPNGALANPKYPDCGPYSLVSPLSPGICRYDYGQYIALQPDVKTSNVAVNGRLKLSGDAEAYVESSFTRNQTLNTVQPVTISPSGLNAGNPYIATLTNFLNQYPQFPALRRFIGQTATFITPNSPYYPTAFAAANNVAGQPLPLYFRSVPSGSRQTQDVTDSVRLVAGSRGTLAGWDYDTSVLYSRNRLTDKLVGGWARTNEYLSLVNSGVINPFGPTTDPAALQAAQDANYNGTFYVNTSAITAVNAKVSGDLFQLPAGMAGLALGVDLRRESIDLAPSDASRQNLVLGFGGLGGVPTSAKRNVASAYAEVNLPLLKTLEGNVAVRYDDYQRVGSTVNPKASLRWQPSEQLLMRGSYGTGFRAPTLYDLNQPQSIGGVTTNGQVDSKLCPDPKAPNAGSNPDCNAQYNLLIGGNPQLKPEKSQSVTFGALFEPSRDTSVGLDVYRVTVTDTIVGGAAPYQTILANQAQFGSLIFRGADGRISAINQGLTNLGKTVTSGVDVAVKSRVLNSSGHQLTLRLDGTYITKYDRQNLDGSYTSSINNPGVTGAIGAVLRWRHTASATWETGDWSSVLGWNYQNRYHDTRTPKQPADSATRDVASYSTLDAQLSYAGLKATKLTLGVKNLANVNPPYTNYGGGFVGSYDLSYADVRGRFVYVTAGYTFK